MNRMGRVRIFKVNGVDSIKGNGGVTIFMSLSVFDSDMYVGYEFGSN